MDRHVPAAAAVASSLAARKEDETSPTSERVRTLHPEGKQGVNIDRAKYDSMRRALLKVVPRRRSGVPFQDLRRLVRPLLDAASWGPRVSIRWYVVTVKQDLEARGLVEQVPNVRPQHLRRTGGTR